MGTTERVKLYLENKGISKYIFYKITGFSNKFLDNSSNMGTDRAEIILRYYPDINPEWLLTGEGSMLKPPGLMTDEEIAVQDKEEAAGKWNAGTPVPNHIFESEAYQSLYNKHLSTLQELESKEKSQRKLFAVPLLPIEAVAGFAGSDNEGVRYEDCERYAVPEFERSGVEFVIRVSGSSMYPKYSNGDILACRKINDILFFQWGKVYVIDSSQGALIKRIFEHENPDYISLVSDNKEKYPPFPMPKSDIRSLSVVLGVIRME